MSKALLEVKQQLYANLGMSQLLPMERILKLIRVDHAAVIAIAAADGAPSRWNRGKKDGGISYLTYKAICRRSGEFKDGKRKRYVSDLQSADLALRMLKLQPAGLGQRTVRLANNYHF